MRNLLAVIALLVIVMAAVGAKRGWFSVARSSNTPQEARIEVAVDKDKIASDTRRAKEELSQAAESAKRKVETVAPAGSETRTVAPAASFRATVQKIDGPAGEVDVKDEAGREIVLHTSDASLATPDGRQLSFTDVHVGQDVVVNPVARPM